MTDTDRYAVVREGMQTARYWDTEAEDYVSIVYHTMRSTAGHGAGPEYRVAYQLGGGQWLTGTRHTDAGDLMTDVEVVAAPDISANYAVRRASDTGTRAARVRVRQ